VANATVALKVDALQDVSSLLTAHTQGPIGLEVPDQSVGNIDEQDMAADKGVGPGPRELVAERTAAKEQVAVKESVAVKEPVVPKADKPRETRTYKGVVYEKGEDGQWHRL
jgi:hypothetical protein